VPDQNGVRAMGSDIYCQKDRMVSIVSYRVNPEPDIESLSSRPVEPKVLKIDDGLPIRL